MNILRPITDDQTLTYDDEHADEAEMVRADIRAALDNGDDRRAAELIAYYQLIV